MEWLFDADRRIERQLGFPGVSKEEVRRYMETKGLLTDSI
jgi:hypothetical protein